jgi:hypothetical protein
LKEHGIGFSTELIGPIRARLKTQTRRLPAVTNCLVDGRRWSADQFRCLMFDECQAVDPGPSPAGNAGPYLHVKHAVHGTTHRVYPLWQPGDRLWVREQACFAGIHGPHYRADADVACPSPKFHKWRSPRFMPKRAARIWLEVLEARWQRIQEISDADAVAEGADADLLCKLLKPLADKADPLTPYWTGNNDGSWLGCYDCARKRFKEDQIDGGWSGEEDGPRWCDDCGKLLEFTLTDYGLEEELGHFYEHINDPIKTPDEAYIAHRMLCADGWPRTGSFSNRPELAGRVARLSFRHLWDHLNGDGPHTWAANGWNIATTFKLLEVQP